MNTPRERENFGGRPRGLTTWDNHPDYPGIWLSAVEQPCDICHRRTCWRSVWAEGQRFKWGHAYICSEACLFCLKLEGLL